MLKLNFHHLYYFYWIAESGQILSASKSLRIGQPALSTQLKQFEDQLGYRLFDRKRGQTLSLTRQGEVLYRYAKEIFRLSEEMLAAAQGVGSEQSLSLRIGALDGTPKHEVNELIERIHDRFECYVSVHEDTASELVRKLSEHHFDLIVTNSPVSHSEVRPFLAHRIATLPVHVYGAPRFARLKEGFPKSLDGQPFLFPTRHGRTCHLIEDYFQTRKVEVKAIGEAQDGELLRRAALSGRALVPLSPSTIESEVQRGELIAIGRLSQVFEELWIIATRRLINHPVVAYLMAELESKPFARVGSRRADHSL